MFMSFFVPMDLGMIYQALISGGFREFRDTPKKRRAFPLSNLLQIYCCSFSSYELRIKRMQPYFMATYTKAALLAGPLRSAFSGEKYSL
jgi:hypothetical protein